MIRNDYLYGMILESTTCTLKSFKIKIPKSKIPMSNPFSFTKQKKQSIIALLIKMAAADRLFCNNEDRFITYIGHQMELDPTELAKVKKTPEHYPFEIPRQEQDRMTILYYVLFLMRADGKIAVEEEHLCYKIGLKLGFSHNLVMDLIAVLKKYLKKDVPPELMLEHVKKYMN